MEINPLSAATSGDASDGATTTNGHTVPPYPSRASVFSAVAAAKQRLENHVRGNRSGSATMTTMPSTAVAGNADAEGANVAEAGSAPPAAAACVAASVAPAPFGANALRELEAASRARVWRVAADARSDIAAARCTALLALAGAAREAADADAAARAARDAAEIARLISALGTAERRAASLDAWRAQEAAGLRRTLAAERAAYAAELLAAGCEATAVVAAAAAAARSPPRPLAMESRLTDNARRLLLFSPARREGSVQTDAVEAVAVVAAAAVAVAPWSLCEAATQTSADIAPRPAVLACEAEAQTSPRPDASEAMIVSEAVSEDVSPVAADEATSMPNQTSIESVVLVPPSEMAADARRCEAHNADVAASVAVVVDEPSPSPEPEATRGASTIERLSADVTSIELSPPASPLPPPADARSVTSETQPPSPRLAEAAPGATPAPTVPPLRLHKSGGGGPARSAACGGHRAAAAPRAVARNAASAAKADGFGRVASASHGVPERATTIQAAAASAAAAVQPPPKRSASATAAPVRTVSPAPPPRRVLPTTDDSSHVEGSNGAGADEAPAVGGNAKGRPPSAEFTDAAPTQAPTPIRAHPSRRGYLFMAPDPACGGSEGAASSTAQRIAWQRWFFYLHKGTLFSSRADNAPLAPILRLSAVVRVRAVATANAGRLTAGLHGSGGSSGAFAAPSFFVSVHWMGGPSGPLKGMLLGFQSKFEQHGWSEALQWMQRPQEQSGLDAGSRSTSVSVAGGALCARAESIASDARSASVARSLSLRSGTEAFLPHRAQSAWEATATGQPLSVPPGARGARCGKHARAAATAAPNAAPPPASKHIAEFDTPLSQIDLCAPNSAPAEHGSCSEQKSPIAVEEEIDLDDDDDDATDADSLRGRREAAYAATRHRESIDETTDVLHDPEN